MQKYESKREIKGQEVVIRPLTRRVLEEIALWPEYTGPYACYNRGEFRTQEGRDEWYARRVTGDTSEFWSSIHKYNGDLIGLLNIHSLRDDPWRRGAEIGIGIRADECDKGYGEDSIRTFVKSIFEKTSFTRLGLGARKWNKRALRCYEKCGFARCGESDMMINGKNVRFIEMELDKGKFLTSQGMKT